MGSWKKLIYISNRQAGRQRALAEGGGAEKEGLVVLVEYLSSHHGARGRREHISSNACGHSAHTNCLSPSVVIPRSTSIPREESFQYEIGL